LNISESICIPTTINKILTIKETNIDNFNYLKNALPEIQNTDFKANPMVWNPNIDFKTRITDAIALNDTKSLFGLVMISPNLNNFLVTIEFFEDLTVKIKINAKEKEYMSSAYIEWFKYVFGK